MGSSGGVLEELKNSMAVGVAANDQSIEEACAWVIGQRDLNQPILEAFNAMVLDINVEAAKACGDDLMQNLLLMARIGLTIVMEVNTKRLIEGLEERLNKS
jgi:hypothetical protein